MKNTAIPTIKILLETYLSDFVNVAYGTSHNLGIRAMDLSEKCKELKADLKKLNTKNDSDVKELNIILDFWINYHNLLKDGYHVPDEHIKKMMMGL